MIPPINPKTKLIISANWMIIYPAINVLPVTPIAVDIDSITVLMFPIPGMDNKPIIKPPIIPEIAPTTIPSFSSILS